MPVSSPQTYLHDTQVQQIDIDISRLESGKGWWASQELGTPSNWSWITQCVDRITAPQLPIAVSLDPSSFHSLSPSAETFTESTSRYHGFFLTASSDLWRYRYIRYHESVIGVNQTWHATCWGVNSGSKSRSARNTLVDVTQPLTHNIGRMW